MNERLFLNRLDAGSKLGRLLTNCHYAAAVVVPLSIGSVVVAREIARRIAAPLDVVAAYKIRASFAPEVTIGAACCDVVVKDERFPVTDEALRRKAEEERREVEPWMAFCSAYASSPNVAGKTVIIVEEGLVSGFTALAAVTALRRWEPARVVVAAPVASKAAVDRLSPMVDEIVCMTVLEDLKDVSELYLDFENVRVEDAAALLQERRGPFRVRGKTARQVRV